MATAKKTKKEEGAPAEFGEIKSKKDLKKFLESVRDKMTEGTAAPVYALSAMNYVLNLPTLYDLLSEDNKEIARDIWLRIKQSGTQVNNPPILFSADEELAGV